MCELDRRINATLIKGLIYKRNGGDKVFASLPRPILLYMESWVRDIALRTRESFLRDEDEWVRLANSESTNAS